jgi:hypothetical protein
MTTSIKTCFKCKAEKAVTEFYKHSAMADGYLGKCKECTKLDTINNRRDKLEYYTDYDKHRAMQPHRVAARHQYQQTDAGKAACFRAREKWQISNPVKRKASEQVNNAVRDRRIAKPVACEACSKTGCRIHGHHDDYSKPLSVRWLCPACHNSWHRENGEGANAA